MTKQWDQNVMACALSNAALVCFSTGMTGHHGHSMADTFIMARVVRGVQFGHCSART